MIKIAIVDDNREILAYLYDKVRGHYGDEVLIKTISSSGDFYEEMEVNNSGDYDIILMDIVMGDKTGVELANDYLIRHQRSKMIFITGYTEMSPEIFKSKPAGLVHKPIKEHKLFEAIDKAIEQHNNDLNEYIKIETKTQIYNISLAKICYVESEGHYIIIYGGEGTISVNMKLSEFEKKIAESGTQMTFVRCHQSYLVNTRYIRKMNNNSLLLADNVLIPVSRNKQAKTKEIFLDYLGNNL